MKTCDICGATLVEGSNFCHMCGTDLRQIGTQKKDRQRRGEIPLYIAALHTSTGDKTIEVWCHDVTTFPVNLDLLTISAFHKSYNVQTRTMIGALYHQNGIDTNLYAGAPYMDLRDSAGCWLSAPVAKTEYNQHIDRLGCIELSGSRTTEEEILLRIKSYCHFLDIAADSGVKMDTLGMPVIGTGNQKLDMNKILLPLSSEVVAMVKRNPNIHRLIFIERSFDKAEIIAKTLENSYQMVKETSSRVKTVTKQDKKPFVFVSYSTHGDTQTAECICRLLKEKGISYWFAPEAINYGEYASQIVDAIDQCTHFICIISGSSMESHHVLNELNLAFQHVGNGVRILPFKVDMADLTTSFRYYLSNMQWNYGCPPPVEVKAREFIEKMFG